MRIAIGERLRPFSHLPGSYCLLPGTTLRLRLFPALIQVEDLSGPTPTFVEEIPLSVKGPVKDFTVEQDLERGVVSLWGHGADGYFRYFCHYDSVAKKTILTDTRPKKSTHLLPVPRLSLGSHKAQDWELIARRGGLEEIFPIWHRLGLMTPASAKIEDEGTLALLNSCRSVIERGKPEHIYASFVNLFKVGFHSMLSPTLVDLYYQGFDLPPVGKASPLTLLTEGAKLLQSLFIKVEATQLYLLPALPPQFHCGRLVDLPIFETGAIHFEWTKKWLRQAILDAHQSGSVTLNLPKDIKEFRFREAKARKGQILKNGSKIDLKSGKQYYLDNFQG